MPRIARVVIPGCPHHVTQRGNRREDVFFTEADRLRYLELLAEYAAKDGLAVQAYCLMTNHVHLVVVPRAEASLAAALKPVHMRYTQHVNRTQRLRGRLWQGRFFSCPLDDEHLWAAVRYVECNPVRAGLLERAEHYPWSSAAAHCGLRADPVLSDPCELTERLGPQQWPHWLRQRPFELDQRQFLQLANSLSRYADQLTDLA
jgi:putative transposase